jgi:uncharacterized protein (TIGR00251 family)
LIAIVSQEGGVVLPVLAHPGAKRSAILGERAGALRVAVTSPPENGQANAAIQSLLAEGLGCRKSRIALISGATSRQKRFLIGEMTVTDLKDRLAAIIPEGDSTHDGG